MILKEIENFVRYLQFEKRFSKHTVTAYQADLKAFEDFLAVELHINSLDEINYQTIRSWLIALKNGGSTAKTINRKISSLTSFYKFLLKNNRVVQSPMVKITALKNEKRLPVFIKEKEVQEIIENTQIVTENWGSLNTMVLVNLFYATGMRLSELIQLKNKNIYLEKGQIKVLGKGNKERIIPINNSIIKIISDYEAQKRKKFAHLPEEFLVTEKGKKLYPKYAYLKVNACLSNIKTLEKKSPHILRHTFATHLINNGAELNAIKDLLGHSSLAATQVYTHNTIEKLKQVYKNAHPKA